MTALQTEPAGGLSGQRDGQAAEEVSAQTGEQVQPEAADLLTLEQELEAVYMEADDELALLLMRAMKAVRRLAGVHECPACGSPCSEVSR